MKMFALLNILFFSISVLAMNGKTTYQAKIIKPDGYPLEATSVNFRFTVLDTSGSCALYVEDYVAVNMSGSGGLISFALGSGTRSFPVSGTSMTFRNIFENVGPFPCRASNLTVGSYGPGVDDARKIVMQFQDSSGWQTLPAMSINAVPYAMYAHKSNSSLDSQQLNGKTDAAFVEYSTLASLSCAADQAIKFNGVSFSCITVPAGGSSGITSVTTSGTVLSTGGTASAPVISIQAATLSQDGYLTSLDYAEFKAKLSASSTQIVNTLGYAPVSGAAVATQIDAAATTSATASSIVKRDSSGNATFNDVYANAAKINYVDIYKPGTSFNIRLQAPTSLAANYTLILPTTSGTTGQVLSTDASGNLSWINPSTGSVVSVSATAPLASTGGSTPTISITQATSGTSGYLSSADFNTFNNKQTATSSSIIATLGYTPADSAASGTYLQKSNNLSDLTNASAARTNLGLGTFATASSVDLGSASATGTLAIARLPNFNGDATIAAASNTIVLSNSGVTAGTYTKVIVDAKGRVTSSAALASSDVTTALGYTPANATSATQWTTNGSNIYYNTGNIGVGILNPTAKLELASGTASVAPLKFTSGTLLSSAQSGTMEYDGFNFYLTDSTNTRRTIATGSSAGSIDNASNINSTGNITMTPVGSVIVSSTTASTNSNTGALVVKGGLGVAGNINTAGNLNVSGSSVIDGALKLSSMTSGSVLFAGANGTLTQDNSSLFWDGVNKRLGIGSNSPAQTLSVSGTSYFSGNVGIGTTSPAQTLDVNGRIQSYNTYYDLRTFADGWAVGDYAEVVQASPQGAAGSSNIIQITLATTRGNWVETSTYDLVSSHAESDVWREIPASSVNYYTTFTYRCFTVDANGVGNVVKFRIRAIRPSGDCSASSTGNLPIYFTANVNGYNAGWAKLTATGTAATVSGYRSNVGSEWNLYTGASSNVGLPTLTAKEGNVGVGTAAPIEKLHVNGTAVLGSIPNYTNGGSGLYLANEAGDAFNFFRIDGYANDLAIVASSLTGAASGTSISFRTSTAGQGVNGTTKMIIDSGGNVGIGTSAPTQKLSVAGFVESVSGGFRFPDGSIQASANGLSVRGVSPSNPATSCTDAKTSGFVSSGLVYINVSGTVQGLYCEQTLNGGGYLMLYNSILGVNTTEFWYIPKAQFLSRRGRSSIDSNFYDGSFYKLGTNFMDVIEDLRGVQAIALVATATSFDSDPASANFMKFSGATRVSGDTNIFTSQFASGFSAPDFDNDTHTGNCGIDYSNVSQHYGACWAYNLGSDADTPYYDGGVGPHLHSLTATNLGLSNDGTGYTRVRRITRFVKF